MNIDGIDLYYSALRCKDITTSEALILCLFNQIGLDEKIPSNYDISTTIGVSEKRVSSILKSLIRKEYLRTHSYSDKEVFEIISKGITYEDGCFFCGYSKSYLDKHHYPIRAKDGGKDTIDICSNCHREFHELADFNRNVYFTNKTERLFI